jgi:protein O-GlcNAc transferase
MSNWTPRNPIQELMALFSAGRFAEMERQAKALHATAPDHPVINELYGIAVMAQSRHAEALPFLDKATKGQPGEPQFWENLALCQRELGDFAAAEVSLRRVLEVRPGSLEAMTTLASVMVSLDRTDEAEALLRQVIAAEPRFFPAYTNLGNLLRDRNQLAEAEACYRKAIALNPNDPAAHGNLGLVLNQQGRNAEAIAAAERVLSIVGTAVTPANVAMLDLAALVLSGARNRGAAKRLFQATRSYKTSPTLAFAALVAAASTCDWDFADEIVAQFESGAEPAWRLPGAMPFILLSQPSVTPRIQLEAAIAHAERYAVDAPPIYTPRVGEPPRDRLRVGYLCRDFHGHPGGRLFVGVLEAHDRSRIETIAYDYSPRSDDSIRTRLEAGFERFVPIQDLSDEDAARRMADDGCDVIVDLTGWVEGHRSQVLARRPAPVQVQWLGYAGTMGAPWFDYIVADHVLIRPGEEDRYTEKIIRLPHCYQPTDNTRSIGLTLARRDYELPEEALVFCSFNQSYKITRATFDAWLSLLAAIDRSVLWLLAMDDDAKEALRRRAAGQGIAAERIIFAPMVPSEDHLARLRQADLALDCFPYGSHTTASDLMFAGVPLVALEGETFASRVSASILTAAGLPDLVTKSDDEFRAVASRLARDQNALTALRARMAQARQSPLFDTVGFTRSIEAAWSQAYERYRAGLAPDHFKLP